MTSHVWDSSVILSLMEDGVRRGRLLSAPHMADQADRVKPAMERTRWINLNGEPDAVPHVCDLKFCIRVFFMPCGTLTVRLSVRIHSSKSLQIKQLKLNKCQAIVRDGLSMCQPCCGVFVCQPLQNNRHRFCAVDFNFHDTLRCCWLRKPCSPGHRFRSDRWLCNIV